MRLVSHEIIALEIEPVIHELRSMTSENFDKIPFEAGTLSFTIISSNEIISCNSALSGESDCDTSLFNLVSESLFVIEDVLKLPITEPLALPILKTVDVFAFVGGCKLLQNNNKL